MAAGRQPHNKSRLGCVRCKQRHIKCDEVKLTCGPCTRYGIECVPKQSPAPISKERSSFSPATAPSRQSLAIWEFELLHHWIVHVTNTFDVNLRLLEVLQDHVVKEAMHHDFLLHLVLILSALHLALTEAPSFTGDHRAFILRGCSEATSLMRKEANNITIKNAHALSVFPFLVSIYSLSLPLLDGEGRRGETVLDEMINILILIQGNRTIRKQTSPFTDSGHLQPWTRFEDILDESPVDPSDFDVDRVVKHLQCWIDSSGDTSHVCSVNSKAAQAFRHAFELNWKRTVRLFVWPNIIEHEYLVLVRQRQPLALVILAHYAIQLGQCSSQWWCADWGVGLVSVIRELLPEHYQPAFAYPLEKLSLGWLLEMCSLASYMIISAAEVTCFVHVPE